VPGKLSVAPADIRGAGLGETTGNPDGWNRIFSIRVRTLGSMNKKHHWAR
jgi:hypothetical protein